jgi:hypothetical protein
MKPSRQLQIKFHLMNVCMSTLGTGPYEHVYKHIGHHRNLQLRPWKTLVGFNLSDNVPHITWVIMLYNPEQ